ncbi:MAG: hypothetical protein ACOYN2_02090 [Patescibacteria group bacterium]
MGSTTRTEYKIPGMGDVGTPGNRRPINISALDAAFKDYREGDGVVMDPRGVIHGGNSRPAQELINNSESVAILMDEPTTM